MPAVFACRECGYKSKVKDELIGKKIKCPKCQAVGAVGGGKKPKREPQESDDPLSDLTSVNLRRFDDVEPDEDDEDFWETEEEEEVKPKKPRKPGDLPPLSSGVKAATAAFVVVSLMIIGGLAAVIIPSIDWDAIAAEAEGKQAEDEEADG